MSLNKTIEILGIPRSTLFYKSRKYPAKRKSSTKSLDSNTTKAVEKIVSQKSTYGCPRIKAILARDYNIRVTKYMLHKYLKAQNLLILKNRTRGVGRDHSGKIKVDQINTRWATDITSIKCWNGEKLRLAVVLDCCDRSIIAFKAQRTIQACDIELMIQEALLKRFGDVLAPEGQLQLLHDNGPEFIEKKLNENLKVWNIESCSTPTYSPQSNGMVEAWNGTFKRDYVYENCLDDPEYVCSQIPKWIKEYNEFAPHSALEMKTPSEYFKLKIVA